MSGPRCTLLVLLALVMISATHAELDAPPEKEACLKDGFFCFEVTKGPKYSYQIYKDDSEVLFNIHARRSAQTGEGTHSWTAHISKQVDTGKANFAFRDFNTENPLVKFTIEKKGNRPQTLDVFEWEREQWTLLRGSRLAGWLTGGAAMEETPNGVKFQTNQAFDTKIGLENKNLTIRFSMETEAMTNNAPNQNVDFLTHDGHYFLKDKPEMRTWLEKRREIKSKEKATKLTIIIVSVVVGVLVVAGIVFAICKFRK